MAAFLWTGGTAVSAHGIDCPSSSLDNAEQIASPSLRSAATARGYPQIVEGLGFGQNQFEWEEVRDRCNGNTACLTTAYSERNACLAKLSVAIETASVTIASRGPVKHLFLRHAPAQLLLVSPTAPATAVPARMGAPANNWRSLWLLGGILLINIFLWQMLNNVCGKCPNCHHWFARVEINRRRVADPSQTSPRGNRGLRLRAATASLVVSDAGRGTTAWVRHYHQCRMCLHKWETTTQESR